MRFDVTPQPSAPAGPGRRVGAPSTSPVVMLRIAAAALGHAFRRDPGADSGGTSDPVRLDFHDAGGRAADSGSRSSEGRFRRRVLVAPSHFQGLIRKGAHTRADRALHVDRYVFQTS
jgi:hypothetical protein